MVSGAEQIAAERRRQVEVEGFDDAHDDRYRDVYSGAGALVCAALSYGEVAAEQISPHFPGENRPWETRTDWPWDGDWWKPSEDPIRNLVKAGALIAAEIDRLQRVTIDMPIPPPRSRGYGTSEGQWCDYHKHRHALGLPLGPHCSGRVTTDEGTQ